jgi:hypothetical protein
MQDIPLASSSVIWRSKTEISAYCGGHCVLFGEALSQPHKLGCKARGPEDGFPEWKAAGWPVEKSNIWRSVDLTPAVVPFMRRARRDAIDA